MRCFVGFALAVVALGSNCDVINVVGDRGRGIGYGNLLNGILEALSLGDACQLPVRLKLLGQLDRVCHRFRCVDERVETQSNAIHIYGENWLWSAHNVAKTTNAKCETCDTKMSAERTAAVARDFFAPTFALPSLSCGLKEFDVSIHLRVVAKDYERGETTSEDLFRERYDDHEWSRFAEYVATEMERRNLRSAFVASNIPIFRDTFAKKLSQNVTVCASEEMDLHHNVYSNATMEDQILSDWIFLSRASSLNVHAKFICGDKPAHDCQVPDASPHEFSTFASTAARFHGDDVPEAILAHDGLHFLECSKTPWTNLQKSHCWRH